MWEKIKKFFYDSETVFFARFQMFIGAVAVALTYVNPSILEPIIGDSYFPWFLALNGIATEYLRRRREDEM